MDATVCRRGLSRGTISATMVRPGWATSMIFGTSLSTGGSKSWTRTRFRRRLVTGGVHRSDDDGKGRDGDGTMRRQGTSKDGTKATKLLAGAMALVMGGMGLLVVAPVASAVPVQGTILSCPRATGSGLYPFEVQDVVGSGNQQYWVLFEQATLESLSNPNWRYHARVGWLHNEVNDWKADHARLWAGFSGDPNGGQSYFDFDVKKKYSHTTGNGAPACGALAVRTDVKFDEEGSVYVDMVFSGVNFWAANGMVTTKSYSSASTSGTSTTLSGEIGFASNTGGSGKIGGSKTWSNSETQTWGRSESESVTIYMDPYFNRQGGYHYFIGGGGLGGLLPGIPEAYEL